MLFSNTFPPYWGVIMRTHKHERAQLKVHKALSAGFLNSSDWKRKPGFAHLHWFFWNQTAARSCRSCSNTASLFILWKHMTCLQCFPAFRFSSRPLVALSSIKWGKAENEEAGWPTPPTRDVSVCRKEKLPVCRVVMDFFFFFSLCGIDMKV